jgi:hypothetical protein
VWVAELLAAVAKMEERAGVGRRWASRAAWRPGGERAGASGWCRAGASWVAWRLGSS